MTSHVSEHKRSVLLSIYKHAMWRLRKTCIPEINFRYPSKPSYAKLPVTFWAAANPTLTPDTHLYNHEHIDHNHLCDCSMHTKPVSFRQAAAHSDKMPLSLSAITENWSLTSVWLQLCVPWYMGVTNNINNISTWMARKALAGWTQQLQLQSNTSDTEDTKSTTY